MEEKLTNANSESVNVNSELVATETKKRTRKPVEAPVILKNINQEIPQQLTVSQAREQRRDAAEAKVRRDWEIEKQMVTGVFRDLEVGAGGHLKFSARKYKWDPVYQADFKDGNTYTIPLWVAKHLNENCKFPVYQHRIEPGAKPGEGAKQFVNAWNHRFAFVSSDFTGLVRQEAPPVIIVGNQ